MKFRHDFSRVLNSYESEKNTVYENVWKYNAGNSEYGLTDANTFKLTKTGYTFLGWSTQKSGGTIYKQDDTTLISNTLYPDITKQSGTVTLYAQWSPNTYTIKFNENIGEGSKTTTQKMTYDTAANLTANPFTRDGYTFECWSDGQGNYYTDKQSVKNLVTSGTKELWAKWVKNSVPGDTNNDGSLSAVDVVLLQKWLLGTASTLPGSQNADLNADGRINAFDLALLKRLLLTQA